MQQLCRDIANVLNICAKFVQLHKVYLVSICMDLYIFDILWHKWLLHC